MLFRNKGYRNVSLRLSNFVHFSDYMNAAKPLYVYACDSAHWRTNAHAWTIDGIASFVQYKLVYRRGNVSEKIRIGSVDGLLHCNFGWDGQCDGYYKTGYYNTTQGPIVPDDGYYPNSSYNYIKYKKVIVYDL